MKYKNQLKSQMLKATIVPLMIMAVVIVLVSCWTLYYSMTSQVREDMVNDAHLVLEMYDVKYPGEYGIEIDPMDGSYAVYKGGQDITLAFEIIDDIAATQKINASIFCKNVRVLTTLSDSEGARFLTSKAAPVVEKEVLEAETSQFYNNVTVWDTKSFAYYEPIFLSDGTIYGMIGVCRSTNDIARDAFSHIWPVILVCILTAIVVASYITRYTRRLNRRISAINRFMAEVAEGELMANMGQIATEEDDEIAGLAHKGQAMANSLRNLIEFDALTGINNRRYGEKQMLEMQKRSERRGNPICVAIADIDYFKKVNDTYGHEAGDEILKAVAAQLKKHMKGSGFAARWGGEEFLLVFEMVTKDAARRTLRHMLEDIGEMTTVVGTYRIKVTMSFGLTQAVEGESSDEILGRADKNLYEAKENGRNRIVTD